MTELKASSRHGDRPADEHRRVVLKTGGGLVIAFSWFGSEAAVGFASGKTQAGDVAAALADGNPAFAPNAFIRIGADGIIRLVMPEVEMGQGSYTGQATLIAEELCVDLDQVKLEHSPAIASLYALEIQGEQATGTSNTIRGSWLVLREAGAVARTMLVGAAAKRWGVPAEQCRVERGIVLHDSSHRALAYGQVASEASRQPVPAKPVLLSATTHRLIGTAQRRPDAPAKTNGSLQFGIDVRVPGMKVAAVEVAPTLGGRVRRVDDRRARALPGVVDVVVLDDAVAVVAADFWTACKGVKALTIDWDRGPRSNLSTAGLRAELADLSARGPALVAKEVGRVTNVGSRLVEATYTLPMLAHATMEPLNTVVSVRKDGCDIWVGTQVPGRVVTLAAKITALPAEKILVHNQYIGGGFGRRLETDSVEQALRIGKHLGYPVKLVWTREQDIALDFFRPAYHDHLIATLNVDGYPSTWRHRNAGASVTARWGPEFMGKDGLDPDCVDGAAELPYEFANLKVEWVRQNLPVGMNVGYWRGVGQTHNLFPVESFLDELAHTAGRDPVAYRRALLSKNPRAKAVLDLAAAKAGWDAKTSAPRIGRGVALGMPMGTYICAIVEVEVTPQGQVLMRRAVVAVDCGTVVNPNMIVAQVQGGLIFGWSAALFGEITIENGAVQQRNFNDYRVLRINEVPSIEVHIVPSNEDPTGIGEPPTAIAAPCLANAVFAATGIRVRQLPMSRAQLATSPAALDQVVI